MSEAVQERENGYRAFISYSHRDDAAAKSLHKRLETYRLPKKLIGQSSERGPIPERLTPIFRDLDELSAADDLTVEIKAALARSATLIVLCSPGAKASKWVNLEIETFRALHGNTRPVLAALIEGEPADAFPPALIANGQEPVAADFRKNRDGKSLALLKLVAGMAGAPLDALVQRDAQRQYRRVMAITGTALTAALAMALLLVVALRAQSEAERQRQEAEGLVEYMLTDLRDKLKGVGRLDVSETVNERAMKYYSGQGKLNDLPAESLERRARVLHAMGEDYDKKGGTGLALEKFKEAHRTTQALLERDPNNPDRIFGHAQSEYWIGYAAWQQNNRDDTEKYWSAYLKYAEQLSLVEKNSIRSLLELGYAHTNLCNLNSKDNFNLIKANFHCKRSIFFGESALKYDDNNRSIIESLANKYGTNAEVLFSMGKYSDTIKEREKERKLISNLILIDKMNFDYETRAIWAEIGIGRAYLKIENYSKAANLFLMAQSRTNTLLNRSPEDVSIIEMNIKIIMHLSEAQRHFSKREAKNNVTAGKILYESYIAKFPSRQSKLDTLYKGFLNIERELQ